MQDSMQRTSKRIDRSPTRDSACPAVIVLVAALLLSGCASVQRTASLAAAPFQAQASADVRGELTDADKINACISTADQLAAQGHDREALLLYERASGLNPSAIDFDRRLAPIYARQNDFAKAATAYRAALAKKPDDANLLNDFGYMRFRQGEIAEAETCLRSAVKASPSHNLAKMNLALLLTHTGRVQEGYTMFEEVVGTAAAHSNVGVVLAKQGKHDLAKLAFQNAVAVKADLPQARAFLDYYNRSSEQTVVQR